MFTKNANHTHLEIANGPNGYGGWGGNLPMQNLVDDYEMANGKPITDPTSVYNSNKLTKTLIRVLPQPFYIMGL
ncbi:hypothetical protein [Pedobacter psychrodurus]|uniref:hypothetical protein n=1 Tax=Pedobacter psychrodurus TaxID=2530456 RepID=UPI001CEE0691|nr:hypothetical protein [Pedobacter psychrodurus]